MIRYIATILRKRTFLQKCYEILSRFRRGSAKF